jgi:hypothetical protein
MTKTELTKAQYWCDAALRVCHYGYKSTVNSLSVLEKNAPPKVSKKHCRCIPATHFFSAATANLVHMFMRFSFYKLNSHFI